MTPSTWRLRGAVWLALTGPALLASNAHAQNNILDASVTRTWTFEPGSRKGQLTHKVAD